MQLIFLSTLQKEEDNVFRRHSRFMADLMGDRKKIIRIMSAQTFESLRECIAEDENTGLEEDIFQ